MKRIRLVLLLPALAIGAAGAADAGTAVTVNFSGSGFSGFFVYDQAHAVSTPVGTFNFAGSADFHKICYTVGTSAQVCRQQAQCTRFTILTSPGSGKTFKL